MTQQAMQLIQIPKNTEKEVFTVKVEDKYFGVIVTDDDFFVSLEAFDSPLKASNHARSVKRQKKITGKPSTLKKPEGTVTRTKLSKKKKLFNEAEMTAHTALRFKEVWVILNADDCFVSEAVNEKTLVKYSPNKQSAEVYKTYEDALIKLKTLDMVVRKGHKLRRYFQEAV